LIRPIDTMHPQQFDYSYTVAIATMSKDGKRHLIKYVSWFCRSVCAWDAYSIR
jgi:hypothetical protein